jgi:hypothetical protein
MGNKSQKSMDIGQTLKIDGSPGWAVFTVKISSKTVKTVSRYTVLYLWADGGYDDISFQKTAIRYSKIALSYSNLSSFQTPVLVYLEDPKGILWSSIF